MAIQKGAIKLSGKLGELIFYKRKDKAVVRQKPKPYALSEASKRAGKDFGEASKNAAYVRKAFAKGVKSFGDDDLINRLNKRFTEIFKTISVEKQGHKKLIDGNLSLLKGFEFNEAKPLAHLLYQMPHISVTEDGLLRIGLAKTSSENFVQQITGAEAYSLQLMVFNYDLDGDDYELIQISPLTRSLATQHFPGADLSCQLSYEGDKALVIALGISYSIDGAISNDRRYKACQIIEALHLKDGLVVNFVTPDQPALPLSDDDEDEGLTWTLRDE